MQRLKTLAVRDARDTGPADLASPIAQFPIDGPTSSEVPASSGSNVQVAVDIKHHLIVIHDVTSVGNARSQLARMSKDDEGHVGATESLDAVVRTATTSTAGDTGLR